MTEAGAGSRWSGNRLRAVLLQVPGLGGAFWGTPDGIALIGQLDRHLSPQIARQVRSLLGYPLEPADVTNTVVMRLTAPGSVALVNAMKKENPWAYLAVCARNWAQAQAGHRVADLDAMVELPGVEGSAADSRLVPEHGLTPLDVVIEKATETVLAYVDDQERPFQSAVEWFAQNPPTHQGHGHTDAARAPEFRLMGFSAIEVAALARVTWGGRPQMHVTSLLRAFLLDEQFAPESSRPHRLALMKMRRVFASTRPVIEGKEHAS